MENILKIRKQTKCSETEPPPPSQLPHPLENGRHTLCFTLCHCLPKSFIYATGHFKVSSVSERVYGQDVHP